MDASLLGLGLRVNFLLVDIVDGVFRSSESGVYLLDEEAVGVAGLGSDGAFLLIGREVAVEDAQHGGFLRNVVLLKIVSDALPVLRRGGGGDDIAVDVVDVGEIVGKGFRAHFGESLVVSIAAVG